MAEQKRKRGRPKLPTPITEDYAPSRRQAVSAGYTSREVENAVRAVRLAYKARSKHRDNPFYENAAYRAADTLRQMAEERSTDD